MKDLGFGLSPRRFLSRNIWKRLDESGKIIIAFEDATSSKLITENDNKGKKQSYVEASNFGCFFMEPVEEDGTSFSTTKLTYIARVSLGGYVPHLVVEQGAAGYLSGFSDTRKLFNKDYEIDLARREALILKLGDAAANKKRLEEWSNVDDIPLGSQTKKYYERNKTLIDLNMIPQEITSKILNTYRQYEVPSKKLLLPYFMKHKLKSLMTHIGDF